MDRWFGIICVLAIFFTCSSITCAQSQIQSTTNTHKTFMILDDAHGSEDLSGGVDYDLPWDRRIGIKFRIDEIPNDFRGIGRIDLWWESPSKRGHLYTTGGENVILNSDYLYEWNGFSRLDYIKLEAPAFEVPYRFKLYVFDKGSSIPVLYTQSDAITLKLDDSPYNEDFPPGSTMIMDDLNASEDLSGSVDYDAPEERRLAFRFRPDFAAFPYYDLRYYSVRVQPTDGSSPEIELKQIDFHPNNILQTFEVLYEKGTYKSGHNYIYDDGPQFGKSYKFKVTFYCYLNSNTTSITSQSIRFEQNTAPTPLPGETPKPTATPPPGPSISLGNAVITDNSKDFMILDGWSDTDSDDNRELVIWWEPDPTKYDLWKIKQYHVYVNIGDATHSVYLGQTKNAEPPYRLIWREGNPQIIKSLRDGPQFDHSYSFKIYAIKTDGKPYIYRGPLATTGTVKYKEGPSEVPTYTPTSTPTPTPTMTPTPTFTPRPVPDMSHDQLLITDFEHNFYSIDGKKDRDSVHDRDIAIWWLPPSNILPQIDKFKLYIEVNNGEKQELVSISSTPNPYIDPYFVFEWNDENESVSSGFQAGPQFDNEYHFSLTGIDAFGSIVWGPITHANHVSYKDINYIPTPTPDESSTLPTIEPGQVLFFEGIHSTQPLGNVDYDEEINRHLVFRWNVDDEVCPPEQRSSYHIWFKINEGPLNFFAATNEDTQVFEWYKGTRVESVGYYNGPVLGERYRFYIYAMNKNNRPFTPGQPNAVSDIFSYLEFQPTPTPTFAPNQFISPIDEIHVESKLVANPITQFKGILHLKSTDKDQLTIRSEHWVESVMGSYDQTEIEILQYDLEQKKVVDESFIEKDRYTPNDIIYDQEKTLDHDKSGVILDGDRVELMKSYYYEGYSSFYGGREDGRTLSLAIQSNHEKYIGGFIGHYYSYSEKHFSWFGSWKATAIWNPLGNLIYDSAKTFGDFARPFKIKFSTTDRFFHTHYLHNQEGGVNPNVIVFDTEQQHTRNAVRNAAFANDDRYFVTTRNNYIVLVDSNTDKNVLRYTGTSMPMTACTFSPEDQWLYVADTSGRILIYPSGIPAD